MLACLHFRLNSTYSMFRFDVPRRSQSTIVRSAAVASVAGVTLGGFPLGVARPVSFLCFFPYV